MYRFSSAAGPAELMQGYYNPCPDFARSALALLWGSNAEISHPPYMRSIHQARAQGGKLVPVRLEAVA